MMEQNARYVAFRALERCEKDKAWSAAALDSLLRSSGLSERDTALATRLFLGVLQNENLLDARLDLFCKSKTEPRLRLILRLGAYQLLFLDKIPAHAAVSETVDLCRAAGLDRGASLVNAVLRRLAENKDHLPPIPGEGSAAYLSLRYSHPLWLAEKLVRELGYAQTEAFFRANNETAPLCIQVNRLRVSPEEYLRSLDRLGISYRVFSELPGCVELAGGKVTALPGYEDGLFYVQDRAARAALQAAGAKPGMRILDACAAPGGKSFAAALDAEGNCSLKSCDLHEKKLRLIREGADRLGLGPCVETLALDARNYQPEWDSSFDLVLADVPCSGLGVVRHKPEIKYKNRSREMDHLPTKQLAILSAASKYVKAGGTLLYCTCTINKDENEKVVNGFLRHNKAFTREEKVQLFPHINGTDGFFICKMKKADNMIGR